MMDYYNLDENNNCVQCTLQEWADLYEIETGQDRRRVGFDKVDDYEISTVFLGLDHGGRFSSKPLLFETMIFGKGDGDGYQTRCTTWKEAEEMHQNAIQWVNDGCKDEEE